MLPTDLDKLPTKDEFCLSSDVCGRLNTHTMSRVACDGRAGACVCPRGYILVNNTCVGKLVQH